MSKPLLALHFCPDLVYYGGGPQMLKLLCERTDPAVCEMRIVSLSSSISLAFPEKPGVSVHALDLAQASPLRKIAGFLGDVRRHKPDVIHAYGTTCACIAVIVGRLTRTPVVVWEIGIDIYLGRLLPQLADNLLIEPLVSERVCNSYATRASRQGKIFFPRVLWTVGYRGVPDRAIYSEPARGEARREIRARYGLGEAQIAIATIGGFVGWRDHLNEVRAVAQLVQNGHDIHLFFIGDGGELKDAVHALVRELGLFERVHFLGYVERAAELLPGMDLYINNSYGEGFGIATVEAMLCALPVVAAAAGANCEVVEHDHTGLLVARENAQALAQGVERILNDPALARRLSEQGRRSALDFFSPQQLADAHLVICRRLSGRQSP